MLRLLLVCLAGVAALPRGPAALPEGPQGPPGAKLVWDLLSRSEPGLSYPAGSLGVLVAQDWPPHVVNDEDQSYVPEAAVQDPNTGEITITAQRHVGASQYD